MSDETVTVIEVKPRNYTVSYARKVGRENYGSEEFNIFVPVQVEDSAKPEDIAAAVNGAAAFAKTIVYEQLGLVHGVDEATGRVVELEQAPETRTAPPKGNTRGGGGGRKGGGGKGTRSTNSASKDDLFRELMENPSHFEDLRATKKGNQPDFRHTESERGLWLDSAPEWFVNPFDAI